MRLSTPKFLRLWVADIALRMIHLTNCGLILKIAQEENQNFLWLSTWKDETNLGKHMIRKLLSPKWQHQDIYENTATTTDGYGYWFFDFQDKK